MQEITTRKEDQTFDCKSIQIDPKALAITIVAFANADGGTIAIGVSDNCLLYTSPSPRDRSLSRMPSSA